MRSARVFAGVVAAATLSTAAWACRCAPLTPAAAYRAADAVLLVTVISSKDTDRYRRVYSVDVKRAWKHGMGAKTSIATRKTTCMLDLAQGGSYLVYVTHKKGGVAESTACSGSIPAADAVQTIAWLDLRGKPAS